MLDKKGRLFGKISIIDILVVCLIILAIFGALSARQSIAQKATEGNITFKNHANVDVFEVKMRLNEVRQMTLDAIHVGDKVYAISTKRVIGEITDIHSEPAKRHLTDLRGQVSEALVPEKMDVILTLKVPGRTMENGYFTIDNYHLAYAAVCEIQTETILTSPIIESVKPIQESE